MRRLTAKALAFATALAFAAPAFGQAFANSRAERTSDQPRLSFAQRLARSNAENVRRHDEITSRRADRFVVSNPVRSTFIVTGDRHVHRGFGYRARRGHSPIVRRRVIDGFVVSPGFNSHGRFNQFNRFDRFGHVNSFRHADRFGTFNRRSGVHFGSNDFGLTLRFGNDNFG
ncbi:MAG: hypothetical protein AAGI17_09915, partial [Planctomycetota bacterium]